MELDLTKFADAVQRLAEGLARIQETPDDSLARDGVIQRFEFTYELAHKMLRRYLAAIAANPETIRDMEFADLIRTGNAHGLLRGEWKDWKGYRNDRALTSHTYDQAKALQVLEALPAFLEEARFLLERLKEKAGT